MDWNTLLTVGFVVLVAATLFVTAHAGAVAIGVLPSGSGIEGGSRKGGFDESPTTETTESTSADHDDGADGSRITAADRERIRSHLEKDRCHRRPDDLLPSDDDGS